MDARSDADRAAESVRKSLRQLPGGLRIPVSGQGKRLRRDTGSGQNRSPHMRVAAGEAGLNVPSHAAEPKGKAQSAG